MRNTDNYQLSLNEDNHSDCTVKTYIYNIKHFLSYTNNKKISVNNIKKYIEYQIKHNIDVNSIRLRIEVIKSYLRFLKNEKLIKKMQNIQIPKSLGKFFDTIDKRELMIIIINTNISKNSWINQRKQLLFKVLFFTGVILNEISNSKRTKNYYHILTL